MSHSNPLDDEGYLNDKLGIKNTIRSEARGVNEALDSLKQSQLCIHGLMVYPDLITLRHIYQRYIKLQVEERNEIILILPYYETTNDVRNVLSESDYKNYNDRCSEYPRINVSKYE